MVIDETHSIDLCIQANLTETTGSVSCRIQALHTRLKHDCLLDERIGSLATIDAIGQVSKVVLLCFILGDTALIWYITAHLDEFRAEGEILLVYLCICHLVFGDG